VDRKWIMVLDRVGGGFRFGSLMAADLQLRSGRIYIGEVIGDKGVH
jgi:hypothetical protein